MRMCDDGRYPILHATILYCTELHYIMLSDAIKILHYLILHYALGIHGRVLMYWCGDLVSCRFDWILLD